LQALVLLEEARCHELVKRVLQPFIGMTAARQGGDISSGPVAERRLHHHDTGLTSSKRLRVLENVI
jgi:hypothetical protein